MLTINAILVPVDLSDKSTRAAELAASLATTHQARLYLLHVTDPIPNIGRIGAGTGVTLVTADGTRRPLEPSGYEHFRPTSGEGS